ncbi:unnamed protein product, partial [marine sediment metagenome]
MTAKGPEAKIFRRFLLEKFGLQLIVYYPRQGLFESVTKGTMIIAGIKSKELLSVKGLSIDVPLEQIDQEELLKKLIENNEKDFYEIVSGVIQNIIKVKDLYDYINKGWRVFFGCGKSVKKWISDNLIDNQFLKNLNWKIKRGRVGNQGLSDLLFISSNKKLWNSLKDKIPQDWLKTGVKNSDQSKNIYLRELQDGYKFLCIPEPINDKKDQIEKILNKIIQIYKATINIKKGKQKKKEKSTAEIGD